MGQEFELKFAATAEALDFLKGHYPQLAPIIMHTTYYDTPDGKLSALRWTLRRRTENGRSVCTLKTPAGALSRNEWEVEAEAITEATGALCALGAPEQLRELTGTGLVESCGARFTRLAGLIELEGATVELALDAGILTGGGREQPFTEVEVELKGGSQEAAVQFAQSLAASLGLTPENRSKAARAHALTQREKE